tara:strand:+ start:52 stop:240 length:189 start_codon:yes stop_codon:yes gene_type:complete
MSKEFKNVHVCDIHLYLMDDDGNELLNDDYTVKLFKPKLDYDFSYIAERFELSDLEEVSDEV